MDPHAAAPGPSRPKTVLIVDDDQEVLHSIRMILDARGFRVVTATDGNQGLAVAERETPDLMILDMMMPKKSGFLVAEHIKKWPANRPQPQIIMITANEGKRHEAYAELVGVAAYIRKPFGMEKLLEEVYRLIGDPRGDATGTPAAR